MGEVARQMPAITGMPMSLSASCTCLIRLHRPSPCALLARGFRVRLAALRLRTQDSLCSSAHSLRNGCFQAEIRPFERILAQRGDDPLFILKFHPHAGLHVPAIADNSFLENLRMVFRVCGSFLSVNFFSLSMAYVRFNYRGQESVLANVLQCRKYCGD